MCFDEHFNVLFAQWFQKKTLNSTPLGFVPEFDHPESCVFLALGCCWAAGQGLVRPPGQDTPGTGLDGKAGVGQRDLFVDKQISSPAIADTCCLLQLQCPNLPMIGYT